jgi:peptide/nickel transport system permease protein
VLIGVTFIVFISVYLAPGDVVQTILGMQAGQEAVAALRQEMGLDQPILIQYLRWLGNVVQGNLGHSPYRQMAVATLIAPKIVNSLILAAASLACVLVVGLVFSAATAGRRGASIDRSVNILGLILVSVPAFWLGITLIYFFGVKWRLFPVSGMGSVVGGGPFDIVRYLVLPTLTTAAAPTGMVIRVMRASIEEVFRQQHILAAMARGLSRRRVVYVHAVRNALPAFAGIVSLQIGYLFGGVIFSEVVFNWPGIGLLLYQSILQRDAAMIQGCTLAITVVFVLTIFLCDVVIRYLDVTNR